MYSLNLVTVITLFDLKDNQQVQFGSRPRIISDYSGTQETESLTEHPDDGLPAAVGPLLGGAHAAHCGKLEKSVHVCGFSASKRHLYFIKIWPG